MVRVTKETSVYPLPFLPYLRLIVQLQGTSHTHTRARPRAHSPRHPSPQLPLWLSPPQPIGLQATAQRESGEKGLEGPGRASCNPIQPQYFVDGGARLSEKATW